MFIINCDNKGCMKPQAAQLNVLSDEVICIECGKSITNISSFAKRQLKSMGQTTKNKKSTETYSVKCQACEAIGMPVFKNNQFICKSCQKEITNLSDPFKILLMKVIRNENF